MKTNELLKEKELQKEINKLASRLEKMRSIQYKEGNKSRLEQLRDWLIETKCFKKKEDSCICYTRASNVKLERTKNSYKLNYNEEEVYFDRTFKGHYSCCVKTNDRILESPDGQYRDYLFITEGQKKIDDSEFQRVLDSAIIPIIDATVR